MTELIQIGSKAESTQHSSCNGECCGPNCCCPACSAKKN